MSDCRNEMKRKRLRNFFMVFESKSKGKDKIEEDQENHNNGGMTYIQMRLPIEDISADFEEKVREKVRHNYLHPKIREATIDDLKSVMYIHNIAWLTSNTPFSPISIKTLETLHNCPYIKILIARVYGIDAGFIILDFDSPEKQYGVIAGLGVLPRFQRKGLGITLGLEAWNYFKQKDIIELRCEVYIVNERSYSFIKSMGFKRFDIQTYKLEDYQQDLEIMQ